MIYGYPADKVASLLITVFLYMLCLDIHLNNSKLSKLIAICMIADIAIFFVHFDSMALWLCHIVMIFMQIVIIKRINIPQSSLLSYILGVAIAVKLAAWGSLKMEYWFWHDAHEYLMPVLTCAELLVLGFMNNGLRTIKDIMANDPHFSFRRKNDTQDMVGISC